MALRIAAKHALYHLRPKLTTRLGAVATTQRHTLSVLPRQRWFTAKAEEEAKKDDDTKPEEEESVSEDITEEDPVKNLQAKLEAAEAKAKDFRAQSLRLMADMENVRKRARVDVDKANKYAVTGLAKQLLDVSDNLERALAHVEEEASAGENKSLTSLYEGVKMTDSILQKALGSAGIVKFESLGEKFDPNIHDGLFQYQDPEKEPGTCGTVTKEGYMIGDRCLRPAAVGTIQAPPESEK